MNWYTTGEVEQILDEAGVRSGDILFAHSALFALGRLRGEPIRSIPAKLVETLRAHLQPSGTLVVPAFNFGFCRGKPFDRQQTPAEKMGPLAEYVRKLPDSVRSPHAIQSVAAVGGQASALCSVDTPSAFDEEGPFGQMLRQGAKLIQLGGTTISLAHYAEQKMEVPYRFWKSFTGWYVDSGTEKVKTYRMYARDLDLAPVPYFDSVLEALRRRSRLFEARLGGGSVRVFGFRAFIDEALRQIADDPYALVEDAERIRAHYA
jgi:aminoglycoside N3'-acetyltransferase